MSFMDQYGQHGMGIKTKVNRQIVIQKLFLAGKTYREIAEILNVSHYTIRKYTRLRSDSDVKP